MTSPGAARAAANDATVAAVENPPTPDEEARRVRRLHSDVAMCRRVLDELGDAPAKVEAKYAKFTKGMAAELKEAKAMVARARKALKDAEQALKAEGIA